VRRGTSAQSGLERLSPNWAQTPDEAQENLGVRIRLQIAHRIRDLVLFDLDLDGKLRGFDLVKLRLGDVAIGRSIRSRCIVVRQKTGRPVQFGITYTWQESLIAWLVKRGARGDASILPSRSNRGGHLTTRQRGRLVDEWAEIGQLRGA
jgi:hypothetical protein